MKISFSYFLLLFLLLSTTSVYGKFQLQTDSTKLANKKRTRSKLSVKNDSLVYNLGELIEKSIHNSDSQLFMDHLDTTYFINRVTHLAEADPSLIEFNKGYSDGTISVMQKFPKKLSEQLNNSYYDFIDYYYDYDIKKYRLLFRFFSENEGFNYHDYILTFKDGKFLIADIYMYTTGENFTDTLNRFYKVAIPKNFIEKMWKADESNDISNFISAQRANKSGEFEEALRYLNLISGELKNSKIFFVVKIQITSNLEEAIYVDTIKDLVEEFKDDPSIGLWMVDYYWFQKDYQNTYKALDQLQQSTGDRFLNLLRGTIAYENEDYERSARSFEIIINEYSLYYDIYITILTPYVKLGRFQDCIKVLDFLLTEKIYDKEFLVSLVEDDDEFGENILQPLADSQEYRNWKTKK